MKYSTNSNKKIIPSLCKCLLILMATIAVFLVVPKSHNAAYAYMGPKPSVQITFENMDDEICYGTLLSKTKSTGPSSVWNGEYEHIPNGLPAKYGKPLLNMRIQTAIIFCKPVGNVTRQRALHGDTIRLKLSRFYSTIAKGYRIVVKWWYNKFSMTAILLTV